MFRRTKRNLLPNVLVALLHDEFMVAGPLFQFVIGRCFREPADVVGFTAAERGDQDLAPGFGIVREGLQGEGELTTRERSRTRGTLDHRAESTS